MASTASGAPDAPHSDTQLPQRPVHSSKPSVDELFEHRWRQAYEVRALERESRQGMAASRPSSSDALHPTSSAADKAAVDKAAAAASTTSTAPTSVNVQAAAGDSAAAALNALLLRGTSVEPKAQGGCVGGTEQGAAPQPPSGQQQVRPQEVIDDEEEVEVAAEAAGDSSGGHGSALSAASQPVQQPLQPQKPGMGSGSKGDDDGDGEEDDDLQCKLVWDSSSRRRLGPAAQPHVANGNASAMAAGSTSASCSAAVQFKEEGNACLKAGNFEAAVQRYTAGIAACTWMQAEQPQQHVQGPCPPDQQHTQPPQCCGQQQEQAEQRVPGTAPDHHLLATLHSNRAHALLRLKRSQEAAADALQAHRLSPTWPKPLYRLAQAKLALGHWAAAVAACKKGEQLCPQSSEGHTEFTPLLDRVAVHAARAGSLVGFDGQQLEVRSAGEEAWLGGPAPHVPELDGPLDDDSMAPTTNTMLALPSTNAANSSGPSCSTSGALSLLGATAAAGGSSAGSSDALAAWDYRQSAELRQRRRTSFRSIREAVAAAKDGDRILLRRGVHNGMGESVHITKRLLIEGEGVLGEAVIDQRANCPTFRITRGGVVLRGIDLDQTGFREALLVGSSSSSAPVHPLIQGCSIKCSGDDAINVSGAAAPTFLGCIITARKCGVKAFGSSVPRMEQCAIEKCGEQGVRAMEAAAPVLHICTISECGEEAAVAMDCARLSLHNCTLRDCKGPGADLSGAAQATIQGGSIRGCVGGVWLWDGSRAALHGASVVGGPSHAILTDGAAAVEVRDSTIEGSVHATEAAWERILHPSNTMLDPAQPTDFPPEEGPFRFVPNRFTRKQ